MAKSREKIQQLGFWDAEVSKPDHDAVCLWAYENADLIFRTVCPERFDQPWFKDEVHLGWDEKAQERIELAREFSKANPRPNPRAVKKTLEYVLKSYTGYQDKMERIVGYADLLLETELPCISPRYKAAAIRGADDEFDCFELGWCRRLEWARPYVEAPRILVEAKSVMPTVGELMRQIQLYRTAFSGKFVVVSPDESYAQILAEQGVTFIKYKP
jgi:hypothetical protein